VTPAAKPWLIGALITLGALVVLIPIGIWLRSLPPVQSFIATYPGTPTFPAQTPVGIPAWLGWQHFLNAFFLLLIIRTGLEIRSKKRPPAFWTPRRGWFGVAPRRVGINVWFHISLDTLWVLNGVLYIVLLFVTGQWMRIVPTNWDVVPNALSTAIQYASLNWPTENPWVSYNALQVLAYFAIVFIVAPLSLITGARLSPRWPLESKLNRALPERPVRWLHNFLLVVFIVFIVQHVALVLLTGALVNLNAMYAATGSTTPEPASMLGLSLFVLSLLAMFIAWISVRPSVLKRLAKLSGKVQ
jgi:thiosulfate reductase cytochrome b subunit